MSQTISRYGKEAIFNFLKNKKYHALLVGLAVASIHFVITSVMSSLLSNVSSYLFSFADLIAIALTAPGMVILIIISMSLSIAFPDLGTSSPFLVFVIVFSSSFYGVTMAFLASTRKILRQIAFIFIGLLILANCFILLILAGAAR